MSAGAPQKPTASGDAHRPSSAPADSTGQQRWDWAPPEPDPYPLPELSEVHKWRQATQDRLRNKGLHPLLGRPIAKNGKTCGDCAALHTRQLAHRKAWKCENRDGWTPATDVRKSWPACDLFKAAP